MRRFPELAYDAAGDLAAFFVHAVFIAVAFFGKAGAAQGARA